MPIGAVKYPFRDFLFLYVNSLNFSVSDEQESFTDELPSPGECLYLLNRPWTSSLHAGDLCTFFVESEVEVGRLFNRVPSIGELPAFARSWSRCFRPTALPRSGESSTAPLPFSAGGKGQRVVGDKRRAVVVLCQDFMSLSLTAARCLSAGSTVH